MDLRRQFVLAAVAPGANVSELCREFGISRTHGYKWIRRFKAEGEAGLKSRSRRPISPSGISGEMVMRIVELRHQHPKWGPKKLRQLLLNAGAAGDVPSVKTVARVLDRVGLPRIRKPRRRLRIVVRESQELDVNGPNDVWTVDFKGWWRTLNRRRFEPLTVRDAFSRFLLCLEMLGSTKAVDAKAAFEELFERYGLPKVIRVDNGSPFGCTSAPAGLTGLSAWWTSLGIRVSFSRPAHPQDNGAHERMHVDVAAELEADPSACLAAQQRAADDWRKEFNEIRPHEAISMRTPAQLYRRSSRPYRGVRPPAYPRNWAVRRVTSHGCVRYAGKSIFITESIRGFDVAVRRTKQGRLAVRFYDLDLGSFDLALAPTHHSPPLVPSVLIPTPRRVRA